MADFQNGTQNTIGSRTGNVGGHFPVWARVDKLYQGGGVIDTTSLAAGTVIPAGTMVHFAGPGKAVTIVSAPANASSPTSAETTALATVNGLIFDDVCVPTGCKLATCAVVRAGRIYADRVSLPASIESQLPMVEFVREA